RDGYKSRLDALQAAILQVKLKYIDEWNERRRDNARVYDYLLRGLDLHLPVEKEGCKHIYYSYVIALEERDELQRYLREKGVETAVYYPVPLHLISIYGDLGYKEGDFPRAERASKMVLSLPMYPEIKREEIEFICDAIREKMGGNQR
ncbi:MAG: DegT/DnrJ/EryC1/StrS family aminotransferase, partial [bacterium]